MSENIIYYNYDDFKKGISKILLVTGYSGSGKSTLAKKLSDENNCEYIELDDLATPAKYTDKDINSNPYLKNFFKNNAYAKEHRNDKENWKMTEYFLNYCMNNPLKEKIILEGITIYDSDNSSIVNFKKELQYSIIVILTNKLISVYRSIKRDGFKFSRLVDRIKYISHDEKNLLYFINTIKENKKQTNYFKY